MPSRNTLLAVALGAAALLWMGAASGPVSRYLLHSAHVSVLTNDGKDIGGAKLFRLDTTTGQTWEYIAGEKKDGTPYSIWVAVTEK